MNMYGETLGGTTVEVNVELEARHLAYQFAAEGMVMTANPKRQNEMWERINTHYAWAVVMVNPGSSNCSRLQLNQATHNRLNEILHIVLPKE